LLTVLLAVEKRRPQPSRIELGSHGRQALVGNWSRHDVAFGAVKVFRGAT
jgi:hypothetical protein